MAEEMKKETAEASVLETLLGGGCPTWRRSCPPRNTRWTG